MRNNRGSLISVWVPGNHGAGGSTIALALGIALQHLTNKRTLILNMGSMRNYMEQYIRNDVDARFSMDHLKSFGLGIRAEHIQTYSSAVNEHLYLLPNSRICREISKVDESFYERFLEEALNAFEFVIADLEAGLCKENHLFLNKADEILAVMNTNAVMLQEVLDDDAEIRAYLNNEKVLPVFNGLHMVQNDERNLNRLNKRLGLKSSFGITYDIKANHAASYDGKFYSYLKKELNKAKSSSTISEQIMELCKIIAQKLLIPMDSKKDDLGLVSMVFSRAKLWGEVDA